MDGAKKASLLRFWKYVGSGVSADALAAAAASSAGAASSAAGGLGRAGGGLAKKLARPRWNNARGMDMMGCNLRRSELIYSPRPSAQRPT